MKTVNVQSPRRVLVTGGAGFIGSHICERLHALGWETHALDSLSTGIAGNIPPGVSLHVMDVRSEADVLALMIDRRFDAVVHCAAQTSVERSMIDPEFDRDVNVTGTRRLIDAARRTGVRRFVFMSSGGAIYGETDDPATEQSVPRPHSYYGIHKYVAEEFVRASDLPFAILRPSNVYGRRQRSDAEGGVIAIFCERLADAGRLEIHGDGTQVRDFVSVDDIVSAVQLGIETTEDAIWNVSSGTATSILDAARMVGQLIGREPILDFRPRRTGDITKSLLSSRRLQTTGKWGPPIQLADGLDAVLSPSLWLNRQRSPTLRT